MAFEHKPPAGSAPLHAERRATELNHRHGHLDGATLIAAAMREHPGRFAVVSSFGTESAVLLALMAEVDPAVPVIAVDTGKLFGETLRYRDDLVQRLGLSNLRIWRPAVADLAAKDSDGLLFTRDADGCCHIRKTMPLDRALEGIDAWATGRKRFQSATRAALPLFEAQNGRIKVNPLAAWTRQRIEDEFTRRGLPRHPLEADGYLSVGCYTCTDRVAPGEDPRSGRWAGTAKTECGIHSIGTGIAP